MDSTFNSGQQAKDVVVDLHKLQEFGEESERNLFKSFDGIKVIMSPFLHDNEWIICCGKELYQKLEWYRRKTTVVKPGQNEHFELLENEQKGGG